ncbi:MAG: SDR family oxidoreductase [Chloroflexota bacterium]
MAKKVVVTGGAGFIGSHLAEELQNRGYYVIVLDDLSTGKRENIGHFLKKNSVEFVQGNVTDLALLQTLFKGTEYVFHQAAIASINSSIENPLLVNEVNITGTLKVLLAARDNGVKKVIVASSSSVYSNVTSIPQNEALPPDPISPYALTKLACEYYCSIFRQLYGLSTVCLRYFNIYGPRQGIQSQYSAVVPTFIQRVADNQPPVILGDGNQSRDFIYVKDVVNANILAAQSDAESTYNIGSGQSITINELARKILQLMGKDLELVYKESRPGEVTQSLADINKARAFGYEPQWSIQDGLAETIAYYLKTSKLSS